MRLPTFRTFLIQVGVCLPIAMTAAFTLRNWPPWAELLGSFGFAVAGFLLLAFLYRLLARRPKVDGASSR